MKIDVRPAKNNDQEEVEEGEQLTKTTSIPTNESSKAVIRNGKIHKKFDMLEKRDSFSKLMDSFGKIL